MSLHEALGANGYADENYEKTLALDLLSKSAQFGRQMLENELQGLKRLHSNKIYLAKGKGGGTSVGGGGDGTALEMKKLVLEFAIETFSQLSTQDKIQQSEQIFAKILRSRFEPNWNFDHQVAEITIAPESFRVSTPSVTWILFEKSSNGFQHKKNLARAVFMKFMESKP